MEKSKQTKASKRVDDGVDRVSLLPDQILHLILSCLPTTEEVIRTSILSTRWRFLWTSIPCLDIDYSPGLDPMEVYGTNRVKEYKFTEFVYWVLLNRSLDLDSFRLCCSTYFSMSTVGRWIHAAVTRKVKKLHLVFRPRNFSRNEYENIELPHCLMTCVSLEVLRLFLLGGRLSLPNYSGFPSLRVLELNEVGLFDADLAKAFFKSCPLLVELSLIECMIDTLEFLCISCLKLKNLRIENRDMVQSGTYFGCGDLQISCPKLVFLELIGSIAYNFFVGSLDSLKKAVIHSEVLNSERTTNDNVRELFAGISHVESLSLNHFFTRQLINRGVDVSKSLPNLKTLELTVNCGSVMDVLLFLKSLPDLESVHLNIKSGYFPPECWELNDAATMRIFTCQLKKVEFLHYDENSRLDDVCLLLEHGNALEEMVFSWGDEAKFHEESMDTINLVSEFYRASSTVKLIALQKPWYDD